MSRSGGERDAYIQATIDYSRELLQDPNVAHHLSDKEVTLASFVLDNLRIPDYAHGRVVLHKDDEDQDKFPIIAMRPGEDVIFYNMTPAPLQRYVMEKFFGKRYGEARTNEILRQVDWRIKHTGPTAVTWPEQPSAAALKAADQVFEGIGHRVRVYNRPAVVIRYDESEKRLPDASGLVKASINVAQMIGRAAEIPTWEPFTEELPDTLEAHSVGARLLRANEHRGDIRQVLTSDDSDEARTLAVDQLREDHNSPEDPYRMHGALHRALQRRGFLRMLNRVHVSSHHRAVSPHWR